MTSVINVLPKINFLFVKKRSGTAYHDLLTDDSSFLQSFAPLVALADFKINQDFITSVIWEDLQPRMKMAPGLREFMNLPEAAP